jgi:hypothetical protein
MMKFTIYILCAFLWLSGFMAAVCFAGTIVKQDGTIVERRYKPSYLVQNPVELNDIKYSGGPTITPRPKKKVKQHPLSHVETYQAVMGCAA